jgi:uncharacterized protein YigE (DUF2233 family)
MKRIFIILILFLPFQFTFAQIETYSNFPYGANWDIITLPIDKKSPLDISIFTNFNNVTHTDLCSIMPKDSLVGMINTGAVDANGNPKGLLITNFNKVQDIDLGTESGNFYIKPNGVFLMNEKDVAIYESNDYSTSYSSQKFKYGIQSGPLLIDKGQIPPSLNPKSPNRAIRSGVGIAEIGGKKKLIFVISKNPVTFYELASLFQTKFNSSMALCLTSGACGMYFPTIDNSTFTGTIANYIVIR